MSRFSYREKTIHVRDKDVTVRELTPAQRKGFTEGMKDDFFRGPALLCSVGVLDPKMTEAEWSEEPPEVQEQIVAAIMEVSGMGKTNQKEPNAG